jgi:hypothetical protein
MKRTRLLAGLALAVGMAFPGAAALRAQDRYRDSRDAPYSSQEYRFGGYHAERIARLRVQIARGRARVRENIRLGRTQAAARNARELARDQSELNRLLRSSRWSSGSGYDYRAD